MVAAPITPAIQILAGHSRNLFAKGQPTRYRGAASTQHLECLGQRPGRTPLPPPRTPSSGICAISLHVCAEMSNRAMHIGATQCHAPARCKVFSGGKRFRPSLSWQPRRDHRRFNGRGASAALRQIDGESRLGWLSFAGNPCALRQLYEKGMRRINPMCIVQPSITAMAPGCRARHTAPEIQNRRSMKSAFNGQGMPWLMLRGFDRLRQARCLRQRAAATSGERLRCGIMRVSLRNHRWRRPEVT